jgi:hypothetical protein
METSFKNRCSGAPKKADEKDGQFWPNCRRLLKELRLARLKRVTDAGLAEKLINTKLATIER